MTRTPDEAVKWASQPRAGYGGYCLKFVRDAYAVPSKYGSAREAWNAAKYRHPTSSLSGVPYGAPLFMDKSTSQYGHVALYVGGGKMATTDSQSTYTRVDSVQSWLNAGYYLLGWTEDLNGVRVLPDDSGGNKPSGGIAVDGVWGPETTKGLQRLAGHKQDGTVSSQNTQYKSANPGLVPASWQWVSPSSVKGSQIVEWVQRKVGATPDGIWGPNTCKAVQRHYGTTQDGKVSKPSQMVTAMQQAINRGTF